MHAAEAAAASYCSVAVAVAAAAVETELILPTRQIKYLRNGKIIKLM